MPSNQIWTIKTMASGDNTLLTANSTRNIQLDHVFICVENECDMYFFYEKDAMDIKVFPTIHFSGKGSFTSRDGKALEIIIPMNKDLKVNFSADPGTELGYIARYVN